MDIPRTRAAATETCFITIHEFESLQDEEIAAIEKEYEISKSPLVVNSSSTRHLYWTGNWQRIFPYHGLSNSLPDAGSEFDAYLLLPLDTLLATLCMDEGAEAVIAKIMEDPVRVYNLYDSRSTESILSPVREKYYSSLREPLTRIKKKTLTYKFPELSLLQKDYVTDFVSVLQIELLEEQESNISNTFDPNLFDPHRDELPMPKNALLNQFVTTIVLETADDDYYLTFTYEEVEGEDNWNPEEIEVSLAVAMDNDDILEEDEPDGQVGKDGESYVQFDLALEKC